MSKRKQCINCEYAQKRPPIGAACNIYIKSIEEAGTMKYQDDGFSYCDSFKKLHKARKNGR